MARSDKHRQLIARNRQQIRLFISSPDDVSREREIVSSVVAEINAGLPTGYVIEVSRLEDVSPGAENPQTRIERKTAFNQADIVIAILWKKYGKGTIHEIEKSLAPRRIAPARIVMLYKKTKAISAQKSSDYTEAARVQKFIEDVRSAGRCLYNEFETPSRFRERLRNDLLSQIEESFAIPPPTQENYERRAIAVSLRRRLQRDFFTNTWRRGQFGKIRLQTLLYRPEGTAERLHTKPNFYLTYWGCVVAPRLAPEKSDTWFSLTFENAKALLQEGSGWIRAGMPVTGCRPGEVNYLTSIRHTAKAAEILLFLADKKRAIAVAALPLIADIGHALIRRSGDWQKGDGGWPDHTEDNESSPWSSLYIFRLFSKLINQECSSIFSRFPNFRAQIQSLLVTTECYLLHQFVDCFGYGRNQERWMFEFPDALGEYAPFASRRRYVIELVKGLRLCIGTGGRLSNPAIDQNKFPEFNQALRTAYALRCTTWLNKTPDPIRTQIEAWVLAHYSESHCTETHDIAFLTEILHANNQHAN